MRGCTLALGIISISTLAQLGNESKFNSAVAKIAHYSQRVLFFRCRIEFPRTHLTDDTHRNAKPTLHQMPTACDERQRQGFQIAQFFFCVFLSLEPTNLTNKVHEGVFHLRNQVPVLSIWNHLQ